jgi:hypothetical protein
MGGIPFPSISLAGDPLLEPVLPMTSRLYREAVFLRLFLIICVFLRLMVDAMIRQTLNG